MFLEELQRAPPVTAEILRRGLDGGSHGIVTADVDDAALGQMLAAQRCGQALCISPAFSDLLRLHL